MLTRSMQELLARQRLGFVATASDDGVPNLSPKGTFVAVDDRTLAFGDIRSPGTVANLRARPGLEVNFVDPLTRRGFRANGNGVVHDRGSDGYRSHRALFDRWGPLAERIKHIIVIDVIEAEPLSSPVYDDGAVEADVRSQWTARLLKP